MRTPTAKPRLQVSHDSAAAGRANAAVTTALGIGQFRKG